MFYAGFALGFLVAAVLVLWMRKVIEEDGGED
jgi:hypothetical protein